MHTTRREFLAGTAALPALFAQTNPPRLLRRDCFFGLHFDLHPNKTDTALGRDLTDAMVDSLLDRVKPDYVQYDCKGHAGYLGFPSKTGHSAPGIVKDSLEIWRRVTARRGVGLFIHFSGVWDSLAVEKHPEWARVRPDGKPEPNQTSTFGPYVDKLMIPELEEAAAKYSLDGAWVDGECWATNPDYGEAVRRAFELKTGIRDLPRTAKDPGWLEFLELNREQFRRYVRHYVEHLHRTRPGLQIASNWLYSTMVPERPELPVDFLSGDYLGAASISTAHLEARYLAANGKPWDLMAWGFHNPRSGNGFLHKPAVQLQQEASVVMGQGGGFQIYYVPTRAGHIDDRHINVAARVARFCRDRQALSHKSESVPQVGVLFSRHSLYATSGKLFGGWGAWSDPARGIVDALLAAHYSVDVIPDWKFDEVARLYPLIVVPDWLDIGEDAQRGVSGYVERGGRAIVAGAANARRFAAGLGVTLSGEPSPQAAWVSGGEVFANLRGLWQDVTPGTAEVIETRYLDSDSTAATKPAATIAKLGSGQIAAIFGPIGVVYTATYAPATRDLLHRVVKRIFTPLVELTAPPTVEIALRRKDGRLLVHLANMTGMALAEDHAVVDFIPPAGPIEVRVRLPKRPARVTWEPGARLAETKWNAGTITAKLDRLDIHAILSIA
jgi:hypothetical protein